MKRELNNTLPFQLPMSVDMQEEQYISSVKLVGTFLLCVRGQVADLQKASGEGASSYAHRTLSAVMASP